MRARACVAVTVRAMAIVGLDHVQIAAPPGCEGDARRFYGGVLDLPELPKPEALAARGGAWFALGDGRQLHVGVEEDFTAARKAHPALRVAAGALEALAERLLEAGCEVTWDEALPDVPRLYVDDPWGNRLELVEGAAIEYLVPRRRHDAPIVLADYDPAWPERFAREAERLRGALGERAVVLEHAGSTSVPGMAAKPILDTVLGVPDSTAEADYVPALEAVGYVLRIREPGWHEHRLLERQEPKVNLHVFAADAPEIARMLRFRDLLRSSPEAFDLYLTTKRRLAARTWAQTQDYADAKDGVVAEILGEG
jgi:GrpB-like predicted nucleotidyltransferase (UPF0157 family)